MSARVYLMKTVNSCKDVPIMSPEDEQWRRTSLLWGPALSDQLLMFKFSIQNVTLKLK